MTPEQQMQFMDELENGLSAQSEQLSYLKDEWERRAEDKWISPKTLKELMVQLSVMKEQNNAQENMIHKLEKEHMAYAQARRLEQLTNLWKKRRDQLVGLYNQVLPRFQEWQKMDSKMHHKRQTEPQFQNQPNDLLQTSRGLAQSNIPWSVRSVDGSVNSGANQINPPQQPVIPQQGNPLLNQNGNPPRRPLGLVQPYIFWPVRFVNVPLNFGANQINPC